MLSLGKMRWPVWGDPQLPCGSLRPRAGSAPPPPSLPQSRPPSGLCRCPVSVQHLPWPLQAYISSVRLQARPNLRRLAHLPEAEHMLAAMLAADPRQRPSIQAVMAHPFWWGAQQRLGFLIALSDRVEGEDREVRSLLCNGVCHI